MNKRKLSIVKWADIRNKVMGVNESIVHIIDQISPKDQPELIEIDYLYGDTIIDNGILQIPNKHNILVPVKDSGVSKNIIDALTYQGIPLCLSLENDNEVFINTGTRSVPLNLFQQGNLFGLFEAIDYIFDSQMKAIWSVSAGSRTIIMLPKISNEIGLKRLRKHYGLLSNLRLKKLTDHFEVFKSIAHSEHFSQQWINKILCFTEKWLDKIFLRKYLEFKDYILKTCWNQARFVIYMIHPKSSWENFSEATALKNLNPRPYLINQAKHLLNIADGHLPALRPTVAQSAAPVLGIQKAILEIYELKKFMPIIMSLCPRNTIKLPIYYSLSYQTIFEGSPINQTHTTISTDLRDLKILLDTFQQYIIYHQLEDTFSSNKFEYFHVTKDPHKDFLPSISLIQSKDFIYYKKQFPDLEFPYASYFWNGCISITINK